MTLTILNSIVDITGHRDVRAVETSLLAALLEHVPCQRVAMIEKPLSEHDTPVELMAVAKGDDLLSPEGDELPIHWSYNETLNEDDQWLLSGFSGTTVKHRQFDQRLRYCVPVVDEGQGVSSLLIIDALQPLVPHWAVVEALVKIYCNYLYILRESESDKLTGLYNRRTFDSKFQQLVAQQRQRQLALADKVQLHERCASEQHQAWLGIVDIDHFKLINDNYGHLYGDEILLLLSRQMCEYFRRTDLLFRFGGEEFVVLLEPCSPQGAGIAFNRFRTLVAEFLFPQVGIVTVSIGYAPIDQNSVSTEVFGFADKALYYAKEHGRNQVASFNDLIERGELNMQLVGHEVDLF